MNKFKCIDVIYDWCMMGLILYKLGFYKNKKLGESEAIFGREFIRQQS